MGLYVNGRLRHLQCLDAGSIPARSTWDSYSPASENKSQGLIPAGFENEGALKFLD